MKVTIDINKNIEMDEVIIRCAYINEKVAKIERYLRGIDSSIYGVSNKEMISISPDEILYFESIDKRTFVYLQNNVLECSMRLYEIEENLEDMGFFRATKSTIINTKYIRKVTPMLNKNLLITLLNDEKIILSRRNVKKFKQKIGWE
jgi:DNA-binding LytR/AlgR family response regulator